MSVIESKRGERKFEVLTKANELCIYTIKICVNKKVFLPEYQNALTNDIIRTAKNIFLYAWKANNIMVNSYERCVERENYQQLAIDGCNDLLALMQIAYKLFHLDLNRIEYWGKLTVEVRTLLRTWKKSDDKRFRILSRDVG